MGKAAEKAKPEKIKFTPRSGGSRTVQSEAGKNSPVNEAPKNGKAG